MLWVLFPLSAIIFPSQYSVQTELRVLVILWIDLVSGNLRAVLIWQLGFWKF